MELKKTYAEPTALWRLRHPDGRQAPAMLVPNGFGCSFIYWLNQTIESADEFSGWASGIQHADRLRIELANSRWSEEGVN
jgi:hypothetical protein